jgi:hypothetical protein
MSTSQAELELTNLTQPASVLTGEHHGAECRGPHASLFYETLRAVSRCAAMDDAALETQRLPEQPNSREHVLTPRRIAAIIALVLLAVRLRRHLRFAREVVRHRRRLKLAFTVLVLLRQLRKT